MDLTAVQKDALTELIKTVDLYWIRMNTRPV